MGAQAHNPSTWEVEARWSGVQGQQQQYNMSETSLGCMRFYFKDPQKGPGKNHSGQEWDLPWQSQHLYQGLPMACSSRESDASSDLRSCDTSDDMYLK